MVIGVIYAKNCVNYAFKIGYFELKIKKYEKKLIFLQKRY